MHTFTQAYGDQRTTTGVLPHELHPPWSSRHGVSLGWNSLATLNWLASKLQGLLLSAIPALEVKECELHAQLFCFCF